MSLSDKVLSVLIGGQIYPDAPDNPTEAMIRGNTDALRQIYFAFLRKLKNTKSTIFSGLSDDQKELFAAFNAKQWYDKNGYFSGLLNQGMVNELFKNYKLYETYRNSSLTNGPTDDTTDYMDSFVKNQGGTQPDLKRDRNNTSDSDTSVSPDDPVSMVKKLKENGEEDDSTPMDVDTNPAATKAFASSSAATTGKGLHGETAIDRFNFVHRSPWEPTATAMLYYYDGQYGDTGSVVIDNSGDKSTHMFSYRLNSIYDIKKTQGATAEINPTTTPTADSADGAGSIEVPKFRPYWIERYNYWSVVSCEWDINVHFAKDQTNQDFQIDVFLYFHGLQAPPRWNSWAAGGTTLIPSHIRKLHPNVMWKTMTVQPSDQNSSTFNNDFGQSAKFSGIWRPGMINHEVMEDELLQTWHRATEVPPTPEMMTLCIQQGKGNLEAVTLNYDVSLKYCVQFKDLKGKYQYFTTDTSTGAISSYNQTLL